MTEAAEVRERLIEFFRRDIVGPMRGPAEVLDEHPLLRYSAGVLFPQGAARNESSEASGRAEDPFAAGDDEGGAPPEPTEIPRETSTREAKAEEADDDDTVTLANSFKPAAMGLSFACDPKVHALSVEVLAGVYEREAVVEAPADPPKGTAAPVETEESKRQRKKIQWRRVDWRTSLTVNVPEKLPSAVHTPLRQGLALRVVIRAVRDDVLRCTASLFNETQEGGSEVHFFQVGMKVTLPGSTAFLEHRPGPAHFRDPEELELAMLYSKRRSFAVGHGCAATWEPNESGTGAASISTSVVPAVRVPPVLPSSSGERWLDMQFLSGKRADDEAILDALEQLPNDYEKWIARQASDAVNREGPYVAAAAENLERCREAVMRIRRGIAVLRENDHAMRAFKWMNEAMLTQQWHSRRRREVDGPWESFPAEYTSSWSEGRSVGFWRTFQLAFVLIALPGLIPDAPAEERDLVDLIWFPTGGGKTEAYLGLVAFTIFRRRLHEPTDGGCAGLMRYTLRLLTSQQFQRAASLICACELIRRREQRALGPEPVSIGLWVGLSLTPNDEDAAIKLVNQLVTNPSARNKFQLLACPWCGTRLDDRRPGRLGYVVADGRMLFRCPARAPQTAGGAESCPFAHPGLELPVTVVDETIYEAPPTLIIGTVDKFAMLAWRSKAGSLFGSTDRNSPPDLIIQDELHLISGPLGSMVGLYEGVIDLLCRGRGRGPKIVASTATIRRAKEQCRALFDREVRQFPPAGLDVSDSYFASEKKDAPGRVYVGFLPTAASSPLTAQVRAVAALLQGLPIVADETAPDSSIDPYWTLVQYFSSLKELGRGVTLVSSDIPEYLPSMYRRYGVPPDRSRRLMRHEELTSRKREEEIPEILEELEQRYSRGAKKEERALDTLLATNMISVGVDVDRLGLMMIVTQPKGTSEYIQASSRVGRSASGPGFVLTLYNAGRPRDRSHYEQFRSYHEAFYRFVEPTSVTPYARPALERALHAVMVIVARHIAGIASPDTMDFENAAYKDAMAFLERRVASIDPDHSLTFRRLTKRLETDWTTWHPPEWGSFGPINEHPLMVPAGNDPPAGYAGLTWSTPTSMRNVDVECAASVAPYPEV